MSRRRSTLLACILVWAFLLACALIAHRWLLALVMACLPAAAGVLFLLGLAAAAVAAMHPGRRRPPAGAEDQAGAVRVLDVPPRAVIRRPRRRPDPPPAPLPRTVTGVAAARVDQELMRQRAAAGERAPGYDDFVELMRGAGAADLEDVAAPEDGDQS